MMIRNSFAIFVFVLLFGIFQSKTVNAANWFSNTIHKSIIFVVKESAGLCTKAVLKHPILVLVGGTVLCIGTILTVREFVKKVEKLVGTVTIVGLGVVGLLLLGNHLDNKSRTKGSTTI